MMMGGGGPRAGVGGAGSIDNMSYDQLLQAFGDGSENMGASMQQISTLPTSRIGDDPQRQLPTAESRQCSICLEDFAPGDLRKMLPCLHGFHETCVDTWLQSNGCCPVCKHRLNG
jgi:Ring finger domain